MNESKVPESEPAPYNFNSPKVFPAMASAQFLADPSPDDPVAGFHIALSCVNVMQVNGLAEFTTTAKPSFATRTSVYAMPALAQDAISVAEIARDAFDMSVSPLQNFSKPPPVPERPIETFPRPFVVE